jgi:hypothetical protein
MSIRARNARCRRAAAAADAGPRSPPRLPTKPRKQNKLGGGEGVEGIYGSITATGMQRILDCLAHSSGLGPASALLDVGAGLGRPLLHAAVAHGVKGLYGVEIDRVKVAKAEAFLRQSVAGLAAKGVPYYVQESGGEEQQEARQQAEEPAPAASAPAASAAAPAASARSSQEATDTRAEDAGEASLDVSGGVGGSERELPPAAGGASARSAPPPPAAAASCSVAALQPELPLITCCPVERLAPDALAHVTHAYSFWEGVPRDARLAFGRLFAASPRARGVAVVQRAMRGGGGKGGGKGGADPSAEMAALGFGALALVRAFPVAMSGSGRSFTAYVFMRVRPLVPLTAAAAAVEEGQEEDAVAVPANAVRLRTCASDPVGGRRAVRPGGAAEPRAAPDAGSPCKRAGGANGAGAAGAAAGGSPEKKARGGTPARHMTRSQSAALAAAEEEEEEGEEVTAAPPPAAVAREPVRKALAFGAGAAAAAAAAAAPAAAGAAAPGPAAAAAPRPPRASKQGTLSFREVKHSARPPPMAAAAGKKAVAAKEAGAEQRQQQAPPPRAVA